MLRTWNSILWCGAVLLWLFAPWGSGPARAADDEAAMRKQILAFNDITGEDAINAQIEATSRDKATATKLLPVALKMAKEKKPPLNYTGAFIMARVAQRLRETETSLILFRLCADEGLRLKSSSKIAEAYAGLISVCYASRQYERCEKLCQEFLEMRGDDTMRRMQSRALQQMIRVLALQGKTDQAGKLVDSLLKNNPDNWLLLDLRALVQKEAGQYDQAIKTYQEELECIKKDEDLDKKLKAGLDTEIRYLMSGVYVDANQIDKAADILKQLLKEEPDNPTYHNDLGYIWADHDLQLAESEKLIRKALDLDRKRWQKENPTLSPEQFRDNAAYLDSLGWVLFKQKKYKEAKEALEKSIKEPDGLHIEILDHLADVYLALGDKPAAVGILKKALEISPSSRREKQRKAEVEKKLKANQ